MKKIQFIPLAVYSVIVLYFAIFNWNVFTVSLNISLGFLIISLPLIIVIFLIGMFFLVIQWGLIYFSNLRYQQAITQYENKIEVIQKESELKFLKKDNELNSLKASLYDEQVRQIKENTETIVDLQTKLNKIMETLPVGDYEDISDENPAER